MNILFAICFRCSIYVRRNCKKKEIVGTALWIKLKSEIIIYLLPSASVLYLVWIHCSIEIVPKRIGMLCSCTSRNISLVQEKCKIKRRFVTAEHWHSHFYFLMLVYVPFVCNSDVNMFTIVKFELVFDA